MKSASYIDFYSGTIDSAHYPVSQQHHPFTTPTQQSQTFEQSTYNDSAIISQALALLTTTDEACMNNYFNAGNPNINFQSSFPTSLPLAYDGRQDSVISAGYTPAYDWQMYQMSMGAPVASTQQRGLKRQRSHQRTPSASTVASNGPASPYATNTSYPQIANTDFSPNSPAHYADTSFYQKDLPTPQQTPTQASFMPSGYIPSQAAHLPNAHLAMKDFGIHHHLADDFTPDFYHSSRHSMSSGHESPATPHSGVGDQPDLKTYNMAQNDFNRQPNPNVQLWRTESSQAYQDELYNPSVQNTTPPAPKRLSQQHLSPHRNLVHDRLQTANLVRSASPTSAVSRERSPFRDGSPLAPTGDWSSHVQNVGTAAGMRQQQKQQAEQAELDYHRPALQREPTKTMSPQDAMLEYTDGEQPSLFQDSVPAGYRQHTGGTDAWSSNDFTNQVGSTFGNLSAGLPNQQQMGSFRATSADGWNEANFGSYIPLPPANQDQNTQIQGTPFQQNTFSAPRMTYSEATPDFPATLTSMESSVSEGGPPLSSQESFSASGPQRPNDTRANTGTYTCTYHGCTQRFDTHINLQKHKRDYHRSQQQKDATSNETDSASASARSTESPAPSGSGLTSAAILARNSQAGPHKCTRINPSTNKPCNTIFSRPYDLTRHEDTIHNGRKQKVRCPYCREEKTFSRNDALTRHMRVVHPEVSEAFGKRSRRGD